MFSNLFAASASIGSAAEHAFVTDDANCEVVDCNAVWLLAHHLWSHVTRRSRCVLGVVRIPNSSNTQIRDLQIALLVENQVLWLNVSMQDALLVQVF